MPSGLTRRDVKEARIEERFREDVLKIDARIKVFKLSVPGHAGYPDRVLLFPGGTVFFVELKRYGRELRPLQEDRMEELAGLGFACTAITSHAEYVTFMSLLRELAPPGQEGRE